MKVLKIRNCCIGDAGIAAIAAALRVESTLTSLDMSSNQFGDTAAATLAAAVATNRTLTSLDLLGVALTDASATAFAAALEENVTLRNLCLHSVRITPAGVSALVAALRRAPQMEILTLHRYPYSVKVALAHCAVNRKLLAFVAAGRKTPAGRLLRRDGDNAVMHRVAWFLVGDSGDVW
jgi:Ran GTPase-activating protein (RanGAP) involved in mRNA processing and transport